MSFQIRRPFTGRFAAPRPSRRACLHACASLLLIGLSAPAFAQVFLDVPGLAYQQGFDGLPASGSATWNNNSTITGWYHARTGTGLTIVANDGTSNGGNLYSYGSGTATERALGSLGSSNAAIGHLFWGVRLHNNTGQTITSLDVSYVGEQWRNSAATAQTIAFSYLLGTPSVSGTLADFQAAGTAVPALDFTSPVTGGTAGALNGNLAANRVTRSFTIDGLSIPVGSEILLRWSDPDHTGADHGLSIDEFSVTPHGGAPLPALSIADASVVEGNAGTTTLNLVVSLSAPAPAGGVSFDVATADNTATSPSDYLGRSVPGAVIPAGSDTYLFAVTVNGDTLPEPNETLFVNVTNVSGASVADAQATGTIVNDDAAPTLSITDVTGIEGNAGTTTFSFVVQLSSPSPTPIGFDIATSDLSASAPTDYLARALTGQVIPPGVTSYVFDVAVNGDALPEPDETFRVDVGNIVGSVIAADTQATGTILNDDLDRVHDVQGNGAASPIVGASVVLEGVVTASYQGNGGLSGFFLQEEDADADADPATSEGVFVFCSSCPVPVAEGQRVRVAGTVSEFFNMTQVNATTLAAVSVVDAGNHLADITPATIDLPVAGAIDAYYEAREGMLVTYVDTLAVGEYFELARYGQIELYEGGRPRQYAADNVPTPAGYAAHLDELARRRVILDDRNNMQNWPLSIVDGSQFVWHPHANGGLSAGTQGLDFFRGGDEVVALTGVLHWSFAGLTGTDAWRIRPTEANPVTFTVANPRPATPPAVGGAIKAASVNLLNWFTTIDTTSSTNSGPCGPSGTMDCRGADSALELVRQRDRTSTMLCGLGADVIGLGELENTTPRDAIDDLLAAVNASCGGAHPYVYADTGGTLGTDAIRVAIVYRSGVLAPVGAPLVDLDPVHSRPPTAQVFDVADASNAAFGQRFSVVANHLKSKRCDDATGGDVDANDGQGCFSARRTAQAQRVHAWVTSTVIPAAGGDTDVLLLGDFNSHAMEAPITALTGIGYVDLMTSFGGTDAYSYVFDGQLGHLDYALASASLADQVVGAAAWHVNADEIQLFDYNDDVRDTGEAVHEEEPNGSALVPPRSLYQTGTPWRASDHDPVVVGLFGGESDLAIMLDGAPNPTAGMNHDYFVQVTNNGPNAALNARWSNALPASMRFVSVTAPAGWSCSSPPVGEGGTVTCNTPSLAVAQSVDFTLTVALDPALEEMSELLNTVTIQSDNPDPDTSDNSWTTPDLVSVLADVSIEVSDSPDPVQAGGLLTYAVTLQNIGPSYSGDITTGTAVPAGTTFVSLDAPADWGCTTPATGTTGLVFCNLDRLALDESETWTLVVQVDTGLAEGSLIEMIASLATLAADPVPGDHQASAATVVVAPPEGLLTITPTEVDFGAHPVGSTSAPATVTLANAGDASLQVLVLWAPSAPFARTGGDCAASVPFTLGVGASCTLQYVFAPTDAGHAIRPLMVAADAPGGGTIILEGTGTPAPADIAISIDDGREYVQVGDTLEYIITVSHVAGTGTASATVTDILPPELDEGAWTCVPAGGASCSGGSGNVLSDVALLPPGGTASYVYSAIVLSEDSGVIANGATVDAGAKDANPANDSAVDSPADIIVVFRDGFDETPAGEMPAAADEAAAKD